MKTTRTKPDTHVQSATSLSASPQAEQHARVVKYTITTLIRFACLASIFVVPRGWWMLVPALGAIFLPWFAVVVANAQQVRVEDVQRPGAILPVSESRPYEPFDEQRWEAQQRAQQEDATRDRSQ